jgi:glutamate synthase domain-containing protein 2
MLARAKADLLTSDGEQGGTTQAMQHEMVSHASHAF